MGARRACTTARSQAHKESSRLKSIREANTFMNLSKNFAGALSLIGGPLLLNAFSIPATAYIIRTIGATTYGQWSIGAALVASFSFLTSLGLRPVFIRTIAHSPDAAEQELALQLGLRTALAITAALLVFAFGSAVRYSPIVLSCIAIAGSGLVLSTIAGTLADLLQGFERLHAYSSMNLVAGLSLTFTSIVVVYGGGGPISLSLAYLVGPIINIALLWAYIRRSLFPVRMRLNIGKWRAMLRESRLLALHHFVTVMRDRAEMVFLPKFVGEASFGYFSAATLPADRLSIVPSGFTNAFYPAIARESKKQDDGASRCATRLVAITLLICIPIAILVTYVAPVFAMILFPKTAAACTSTMQMAIWSVPIFGLAIAMSLAVQAAGHYRASARAGLFASLCSTVTSLCLMSRYGLNGAALSYGIVRPLITVAFVTPVFIGTFPAARANVPFFRIAVAAVLMAGLLHWFTGALKHVPLIMAAGVILALSIYLVALLLLRVVQPSDLLQGLRRRKLAKNPA